MRGLVEVIQSSESQVGANRPGDGEMVLIMHST